MGMEMKGNMAMLKGGERKLRNRENGDVKGEMKGRWGH